MSAIQGDGSELTAVDNGWRVRHSWSGVYTGGKLEFSQDGRFFACMVNDNIAVVSTESGRVLFKLQKDGDEIEEDGVDGFEKFTTFCIHPDGEQIISASDNQLIRRWNLKALLEKKVEEEKSSKFKLVLDASSVLLENSVDGFPEMVRSWKGHSGPISCADFHPVGDLFATGSSDKTVKVWSMKGAYCTHNFRSHTSIVTSVVFNPRANEMQLASADISGVVHLWDLMEQTDKNANNKHLALKNHVTAVTSICFSSDKFIFTSGRDKVVNVWKKGKLLKTFPVMEQIEGMVIIPHAHYVSKVSKAASGHHSHCHILALAGEKGTVRVWSYNANENTAICLATEVGSSNQMYTGIVPLETNDTFSLVALTFDSLIQFLDPNTLKRQKQMIGYNDEIIDLKYLPSKETAGGEPEQEIVMATNSEHAMIVNMSTFNSELLVGHSGMVLSVDVTKEGKYIVTASKDNTCRVWNRETLKCVAICHGHTEAVTSIAFLHVNEAVYSKWEELSLPVAGKKRPREEVKMKMMPAFLVSASSDKTLKYWALNSKGDPEIHCVHTQIAHDKLINTVATSPNKALVASGSQDRTIKLWDTTTFALRGELRGHRRGIWHVQFSPTERCLASASADKTIRIWSIADMSCLSVLEGHATSVLRVQYLASGLELITAGSSGILKTWSTKSSECTGTMEYHKDRVWTLAVPPGAENKKDLLSGGGDSKVVLWRDCGEELEDLRKQKTEQDILYEQELFTSLRKGEFLRAALRALELNRPHRLRTTLEKMLETTKPGQDLQSFVKALNHEQLLKCWELAREWNTYARNSVLAQTLMHHLLQSDIPLGGIGSAQSNRTLIEPFLAYSERHFRRLDALVKETFLLDHVVSCMDDRTV